MIRFKYAVRLLLTVIVSVYPREHEIHVGLILGGVLHGHVEFLHRAIHVRYQGHLRLVV